MDGSGGDVAVMLHLPSPPLHFFFRANKSPLANNVLILITPHPTQCFQVKGPQPAHHKIYEALKSTLKKNLINDCYPLFPTAKAKSKPSFTDMIFSVMCSRKKLTIIFLNLRIQKCNFVQPKFCQSVHKCPDTFR